MKIRKLAIKNFKSFDEIGVKIPINDLTTFVGPNNSGKSNVLKALDLFFDYSKGKVTVDCFHNGDVSHVIEITVEFHRLDGDEKQTFRRHLNADGSLTITQRIQGIPTPGTEEGEQTLGDVQEDKHGIRIDPVQEWLEYEKKPSKTKVEKWWKGDLVTKGGINFKAFCGNPEEPPTPEGYQERVTQFWNEHFDSIETQKIEGDSKVLGWANKLKGNLPRLILLPAVHTIQDATKVQKTNPFGMLLNWLLGDIAEQRKAVLQESLNEAVKQAFTEDEEAAEEQQRRIDLVQQTFNKFISDQFELALEIVFEAPDVGDILLGGAQIYGDDGYRSLLIEKGQGAQRSAVFTILRTYAYLRGELDEAPARNTIFAIEEPEIYLHPPIKRATYHLLRTISESDDQVLYSTHDGYFVDVEYFDEIRLVRRVKEKSDWKTTISHFPIEHLVTHCKNRYGKDIEPESLRQSFRRFYDPAKNEGFFSKKVIIVEGETESEALPIYFRALGYDLDQEEVSIVHAGGVGAIDYLYIVFNELSIPCYVVFDADAPIEPCDFDSLPKEQKRKLKDRCKRNGDLLKILGVEALVPTEPHTFPETVVHQKVAVWKNKFEVQIHHPIPHYETWKAEASALFASDSKRLTARYIAEQVVEDENTEIPDLVAEICDKVQDLTWSGSCLMLEPAGVE